MPGLLVPFLVAAAASLLVSVGVAIAALREPGLALKPLWVILAFVGVGGAALVSHAPDHLYWFLGVAAPTVSFSAAAGSWARSPSPLSPSATACARPCNMRRRT